MKRLTKQWKNARAVIKQLRADEWEFEYNHLTNCCCDASRGGRNLWVANGAFFLEIKGTNAFGLILRHYVWWAAAFSKTRQADKKFRQKAIDRIPELYNQ